MHSQLRRERRLERYQQVVALFDSGHLQATVSNILGIERKTIRRWLRRGQFPERKPPHRKPPKVSHFEMRGDSMRKNCGKPNA